MKNLELKKFTVITADGPVENVCHPDLKKAILWHMADGSVSVRPLDPMGRAKGETEDEQLARELATGKVGSVGHEVVDFWRAGLFDRTFRDAWKPGSGKVEHDMTKCREIHKNRLRAIRKPKMEALDVAYMRADELGNAAEKTRIVAQKQALRDVTADPAIEAAQTPEELKAVMPEALK